MSSRPSWTRFCTSHARGSFIAISRLIISSSLKMAEWYEYLLKCLEGCTTHQDVPTRNWETSASLPSSSPRFMKPLLSVGPQTICPRECRVISVASPSVYSVPSSEIVRRQPYGAASDLWAFGCLILTLLTGQPPFQVCAIIRLNLACTLF